MPLDCGILSQNKILSFHLNTITQSIYNSIRENPDMKRTTTDDIKEILKVELESPNDMPNVTILELTDSMKQID